MMILKLPASNHRLLEGEDRIGDVKNTVAVRVPSHALGSGSKKSRAFRAFVPAPGGDASWAEGSIATGGILAAVKGIADTGFLVALANRNDDYHEWAVRIAEGVTEPLLTCEAVLAEAAFHLESVSTVMAVLESGLVVLAFDLGRNLPQVTALARRYAARKPRRSMRDPDERATPAPQRHHRGCSGLSRLPKEQAFKAPSVSTPALT